MASCAIAQRLVSIHTCTQVMLIIALQSCQRLNSRRADRGPSGIWQQYSAMQRQNFGVLGRHHKLLHDIVLQISLGPFTDLPAFEMQHIALTHDGVSILGQARQVRSDQVHVHSAFHVAPASCQWMLHDRAAMKSEATLLCLPVLHGSQAGSSKLSLPEAAQLAMHHDFACSKTNACLHCKDSEVSTRC